MSFKQVLDGLKAAVEAGRTDVVRSVISTLEKNGEINELPMILNEPCSEEGTLLHLATMLGEADIVRTLLSAGADPGVHNSKQRIPLDLAKLEKVRTVFNEELLQATAQSNMGRVCQLLASGLDVNLKDSSESQNTPLHWAACYASRDMIQCLCLRGADVNAVNTEGCTPLHEAVTRGDEEVVEELLIHKADPTLKIMIGENSGKSAVDLAQGNNQLIHLLENPPISHRERKLSQDALEELLMSESVTRNNDTNITDISSKSGLSEESKMNGSASPSKGLHMPTPKKTLLWDHLPISPKPVVTEEQLSLLWPQPQSIIQKEGKPFTPSGSIRIYLSSIADINIHSLVEVWDSHKSKFESIGLIPVVDLLSPASECNTQCIVCHVNSRLCVEKGSYKIIIRSNQVRMVSHDRQSLGYAISTLIQLLQLYKDDNIISVPVLEINDSPSLPYRGVLLDVSQGRVPNLKTLKYMLDNLSLLKMNQVHLYTRFRHPLDSVWQLCYTCSELLEIDKFCMARGMQLIPVLDVGPKVQFEETALLQGVFNDYISHFTNSDFINIGPRLSSFILDCPDNESISIGDAAKFLPIKDKMLLICGYPLHELKPQLLQQLPPHLMFAEYGMQANYDFMSHCKSLADSGHGFIVCPGTAAWNSLAGCPEAAVYNIYNSVKCASSQSGLGLLVCNWTGRGYLTHLPFSWPGLLIAAGLAWNGDVHWGFLHTHLAELLNQHIFSDKTSVMGQAVIELGRIETYVLRCSQNKSGDDRTNLPCEHGSTLFQFLVHPDRAPLEELTPDVLQKTCRYVRKHQTEIAGVILNCPQAQEIISELQLTMDMMILAARIGRAMVTAGRNPDPHGGLRVVNLGVTNLSATGKTDLANRLLELIENYRQCWSKRYLTNYGLQESTSCLRSVLKQLVPDEDTDRLANNVIL